MTNEKLPTHGLENHAKLRIALYHTMIGRGYFQACKAFRHAEELHNGLRKDGITPEFAHQIWIASFAITLPIPAELVERILIAIFYHDSMEDKNLSREELGKLHGEDVADIIWRLTKKTRGTQISKEEYFIRLIGRMESIIIKAIDRLHNLKTMVGVFSTEKMLSYAQEAIDFFLPMLKEGRKQFPEYDALFHLLDSVLRLQAETIISLIHHIQSENKGA